MKRIAFVMNIPRINDPRFLFILFTGSFLMYVLNIQGYGRSIDEFLYLAFWCMFFELLFRKILQEKWVFPISGYIPAFGIFIVCDVIDKIYYIPLAFAAIGSKAFIQKNGHHIFNPASFAILTISLGLSDKVSPAGFLRWDGNLWHSLYIFICGSLIAWKVNRLAIPSSYIIVSAIISPIVALAKNVNPFTYFNNLMWQGTVIFLFFMLTDPKTSPNRFKYQIAYGAITAVFTQIMRYYEHRLAPHIALTLTCFLYAMLETRLNDKHSEDPWKSKERTFVFET